MVVVSLVGACGPQRGSDDTGADDGMASTGNGDSTSVGDDAGESDDAEADDGGSTDGGVPQACEPLVTEPGEPTPLQITLRNDSLTTVFIGEPTDCLLSPVAITGPDGTPFEIDPTLCLESCDSFLDATCSSIDCGACGGAEMIRIDPGATWTYEWDGWIREALTVPDACPIELQCDSTCSHARLPAEGMHEIRASVHTTCSTFDDTECLCPEGSGEEACIVYAGEFPEATDSLSVELTLPAQTVELVIPAE